MQWSGDAAMPSPKEGAVPRLQSTIRASLPVTVAVFACAYVPALLAGYALKENLSALTIIWPAAGVLFLTLYLTPRRRWPLLALVAAASEIAVSYLETDGFTGAFSLLFPVANVTDAVVGATIVSRLAKDPGTPRLSQVAAFFFGSAVGAAAGACIGALGAAQSLADAAYLHQWQLWWAGNWLGSLSVAPVGLAWAVRFLAPERAAQKANPVELVGIGLAVLAFTIWVFSRQEGTSAFVLNVPYTIVILLMVATFRLPPRWSVTLTAVAIFVAAAYTAHGRGPFAPRPEFALRASSLQMFLSVLAMGAFVLSTVLLEKRRLLITLRRNENRYRSFVRHSTEAIWRIELREPMPTTLDVASQVNWLRTYGYIGECSASFESLQSRFAPSDAIADYWRAGIPWTDVLVANFETAAASGYVVENLEFSIPREGECEYWLANFHGEVVDGELLRIWGVARNQTDVVRANAALLLERRKLDETSRMLTDIVNASPLAVLVVDGELRVRLWSGAAESLFGWSASEVEGKVLPIVPAEERVVLRPLRGDRQYGVEKRRLRKDGTSIFVHLWTTPLRSATGEVTGTLAMLADVTEQKRLEAQARQAQKLEALGTLAGGVAHDFNNILTLLLGHVSLARAFLAPAHEVQAELDGIERAAQRGANLVRQILLFGRPQEQPLMPLDLSAVVKEGVALLRATLPKTIDIATEVEENLPAVAADSAQIQQVVINLGINASQAMPEAHGSIRLSLQSVELDGSLQIGAPALSPGLYVRLIFSDDGRGMEPSTVERIFDPFFTTKPAGSGSGLGLSVVRGIVLSHRGAITVYSKPGKGTAFSLYFPAARHGARRVQARAESEAPRGEGHILYVDDEPGLVDVVSRLLEREGYRVTAFTNPSAAIAAFQAAPDSFDAVVTDLSMPTMSGIELMQQLLSVRKDVPVIITTGYINEPDRARALAAGCCGVVGKPASFRELHALLAGLRKRGA